MKKNDLILVGMILCLAAAFIGYQFLKGKSVNADVVVTVDGEPYGRYALSADQIIEIDGTNTLEIRDGKAAMKAADCPDKLCVHQKAISRDGESIICLPNKVVVTIEGGEKSELDGVAK
ncbi:NusG domain II-containing protein [Faecalicatena orotica]|uniref:Uncharacterized protein n=1 Tax=Faecalicatena orotica TaxID=1544 RepID=A0A2Y9C9R5_9FIRM|nr:NusG domain II-containing protein [Faecalicatena orotica]PWJ30627.1 hypothetical protein A8806_10331 [Faecalicatena orotica]SSA54787.1 hypothetical protein SAMN05216536_10331 [Faecalicatena orotica]